MKIIVIGGGVIGMLSAHYLLRKGFEVTVLEKEGQVGQAASAANANLLCYASYMFPPIGPDLLSKIPSIMAGKDAVMKCESGLRDPAFLLWGLQTLPVLLSQSKYKSISERLWQICQQSRVFMDEFLSAHPADFSYKKCGRLTLYSTREGLDRSYSAFNRSGRGQLVQKLSRAEILEKEPALAEARNAAFIGGLYMDSEYAGDCEKFTLHLRRVVERQGGTILTGVNALALRTGGGKIAGLKTGSGDMQADGYVMAAGCWSAPLLRTAGIYAPIYPAKGYTYEIFPPQNPFRTTIVDTVTKSVFTPLANSLKISAGIFFRPVGPEKDEGFLDLLRRNGLSLFPRADFSGAKLYSGYRPWTPDSLPRVGKTRYPNLYLNTGHGMTGWTMAHATGHALADIVAEAA